MWGLAMFTLGLASVATGIVFGNLNVAWARNPDESEKMYTTSLTSFALIETFVFITLATLSVVSVLI